jgi:hypothetical protein
VFTKRRVVVPFTDVVSCEYVPEGKGLSETNVLLGTGAHEGIRLHSGTLTHVLFADTIRRMPFMRAGSRGDSTPALYEMLLGLVPNASSRHA